MTSLNEQKTVIAVFASVETARAALQHLRNAGVPQEGIRVIAGPEATGGLLGQLIEAGVPDGEAHGYVNNVRSGSTLIMVRCEGGEAGRVRELLDKSSGADMRHVEGPGSPSECDMRTADDIPGGDPVKAQSAAVVGHNAGGEPMSADEVRREYARYGAENPGHRVWPHTDAYDLEDSLIREEVLEAEEDPIGLALRTPRVALRARIYDARTRR